MYILYLITSFIVLIWIIRNILFWIYLYQLKEYRFDRLKVHILETDLGKKLIYSKGNVTKIILFIIYFFIILNDKYVKYYYFPIFFVYLYFFIKVILEIKNKKIKIPKFTLKSFSILFVTSVIALTLYLFPLLDKFFWLLFIDKIIIFITSGIIVIFSIPTEIYKEILVFTAKKKRLFFNSLLSIGITGSYGKGSTKEFLSSILSYKYNVFKTYGNNNTTIGVARTILNKLNDKKEIFIAEMGAYKIGEIAEICYFVKPKLGIITGISDQHLSLFGSYQNILKGKYELIESLPRDGMAIFNGNNTYVLEMAEKTKKKKIIYFTSYNNKNWNKYDISALNIKVYKFYLIFDVYFKNKNEFIRSIKVKLIGKQNIENLLPGIFLGLYMKMNRNEIINAVSKIVPLPGVMEPYANNKGTILINDTYNASISSVYAAVDYLKIYKGKKILVLHPMIELGGNAKSDHESIGEKAGKVCDYLFLTNSNYFEYVKKGIDNSGNECILEILNPAGIKKFIDMDLGNNDIVLFEGKEAYNSFSLIKYEKIY